MANDDYVLRGHETNLKRKGVKLRRFNEVILKEKRTKFVSFNSILPRQFQQFVNGLNTKLVTGHESKTVGCYQIMADENLICLVAGI